MSKKIAIALAGVGLLTTLYQLSDTVNLTQVLEQNLRDFETNHIMADECTHDMAVACQADIQVTIKDCSKAYETKDPIADIKCAKDLLADKKHCWPCICDQAKKRGWHVIGC